MNKVDVMSDLLRHAGQKKEIKMKFEAKIYNKLFRFTQISKNSWRFAFPQTVADELGVNENTHYLVFHSPERKIIALFMQSFSDMLGQMGFTLSERQAEEKKGEKREILKEIHELTYTLNAVGFFSHEPRKVWVARTRKGNRTYTRYGAVISHDVAQEMKISKDTRFILLYSPRAKAVTLELRNPEDIKKNEVKMEEKVQGDSSWYENSWDMSQKDDIWDEDVVEAEL